MKNIADIRKDYSLKELDIDLVANNPVEQFGVWFQEALDAKILEPTAMFLATCSVDGKPSGRIVLLKGVEEGKFIFFTNYHSRKGREINVNGYVSLTFFWAELERQVRVEGIIRKVSDSYSDAYFKSRPNESKLGAWASAQSQEIESREALESEFAKLKIMYEGKEIPRPSYWGGYAVVPESVEFWQGRPSRMHDRIMFYTVNGEWKKKRLAP